MSLGDMERIVDCPPSEKCRLAMNLIGESIEPDVCNQAALAIHEESMI